MAITVRFLADVGDWLKGLGKSKDTLDENEQSIEDLMRQAILLGREIGKSTDDIALDFAHAFGIPLDRAKRAVKEVSAEADALERAATGAGDAAEDAASKIEDGMSDAAQSTEKVVDAKEKVGDSLGELGQIAKDVLNGDFAAAASGAAGALGELGAAVGIGGAVGGTVVQAVQGMIAQISSYWEMWHEAVEGAKTDAFGLGQALDDAGYAAAVDSWTGSLEKLAEVRDIATASGWNEVDVIEALAKGGPGLDDLYNSFIDGMNNTTRAADISSARLASLGGVIDGTKQGFEGQKYAQELAARANKEYADSADAANEKVKELHSTMQSPPPIPEHKVKLTVDDSALRNYKPQPIRVPATFETRGRQII